MGRFFEDGWHVGATVLAGFMGLVGGLIGAPITALVAWLLWPMEWTGHRRWPPKEEDGAA